MTKLITVLSSLLIFTATVLIVAYPLMWLWNYVMPDLFWVNKINIWEAIALKVLSSLLFKKNSKD